MSEKVIGVLAEIYDLDRRGSTSLALDKVFDAFEDASGPDERNALLASFDGNRASMALAIGFLSASAPFEDVLLERRKLLERTRAGPVTSGELLDSLSWSSMAMVARKEKKLVG